MEGKSFSSVDDYVAYVLRITFGKGEESFSDQDTQKVEERLRALGYI
jgi:hypothetical protein